MKALDFIINLILGFWKNGFISLCQIVLEHWIISSLVIILIAYLCSDPETAIYAWFLIGIFAFYSAIKAIIEIFIEIKNYIKSDNTEYKVLILQKTGGKIFDFLLCVVGIFQALRIFSHISKITKSASSAVNVVDDVASAISKLLKDLK
jgi:ABC-type polysaccharide/polyol phosphate export permease